MKQTAVEWLIEEYINGAVINIQIMKKALEMEKEQIRDAYMEGYLEEIPNPSPLHYYEDMAEQYYNETFKSE